MWKIYLVSSLLFVSQTIAADDHDENSNGDVKPAYGSVKYQEQLPQNKVALKTEQDFKNWLKQNQTALGFSDSSTLEVLDNSEGVNSLSDKDNHQIYRVQHKVKDIPVYLSDSVFILKNNQTDSAFIKATEKPHTEIVGLDKLTEAVTEFLAKNSINHTDDLSITPIFWEGENSLVYAAEVYGTLFDNEGHQILDSYIISANRELLYVSTKSNDYRYRMVDIDQACQKRGDRKTYKFRDMLKIAATYIDTYGAITSPTNSTTNKTRQLARLLDKTKSFMREKLGQSGIDRRNRVIPYILVGDNFGAYPISSKDIAANLTCGLSNTTNATFFSNPRKNVSIMQMHSRLLGSTQVLMHELGHGIIAYSSNLEYNYESGALNEAYADAIGVAFASWLNGRFDNPSRSDWQLRIGKEIGRDFAYPTATTYVYDRQSKRKKKKPDHFRDRYRGSEDHGGVHINSSIINHAFYLLVEGGSHRRLGGASVPRLGMTKALSIWHKGFTQLQTRTARFKDARYTLAKAAELKYGNDERVAVHMAFDAIGVPGRWVKSRPKPKEAPPKQEPKKKQPPKEQPKQEQPKQEKPKKQPPKKELPKQEPKKDEASENVAIFAVVGVILFILIAVFLIKRFKPRNKRKQEHEKYNYGSDNSSSSSPIHKQNITQKQLVGYFNCQYGKFEIYDDALSGTGITIGRSSSAKITLQHPSISNLHLRIFKQDNGVYFEDLGSSYGSFVNGMQLGSRVPYKLEGTQELKLADMDATISLTTASTSGQIHSTSATLSLSSSYGNCSIKSTHVKTKGAKVGRDNQCELTINYKSMSGLHGRVLYEGGKWWYFDADSSYGSKLLLELPGSSHKKKLNPYEKAELSNGSILYLADIEVRVSIE